MSVVSYSRQQTELVDLLIGKGRSGILISPHCWAGCSRRESSAREVPNVVPCAILLGDYGNESMCKSRNRAEPQSKQGAYR